MSTKPATSRAADDDVLAAVAPVRRVAGARSSDPALVEDVVQETVARLLEARWRLDREALVAYGIVTARNLIIEHERSERVRSRHVHRLAAAATTAAADEDVLAGEERDAMRAALGRLSEHDRGLLLDHEVDDLPVDKLAAEHGVTPGAIGARLARARARLRVEHLVTFRRLTLPTARCRPVLEAISLGDRRRQRAYDSGDHLLECRICAGLADALLHRRRRLTAIWPFPVLLLLPRKAQQGLGTAGAVAAGGLAAAVAAGATVVAVVGDGDRSTPPRPVTAARSAAIPSVSSPTSTAADRPAPPQTPSSPPRGAAPGPALRFQIGATTRLVGVRVQSVPADEGFWVSTSTTTRVWVQIAAARSGRESPQHVRPGQRVNLLGVVRSAPAGMPARVGLSAPEGADDLVRAGAYIAVRPQDLSVTASRPATSTS